MTASASASAQPVSAAPSMVGPSTWTAPGPGPKRVDPLVPTAIAELVVGTAFTVGGAVGVGVANRERHVCGAIAGCFDALYPEVDPLRAGAFSLGFGVTLAAGAGVSLITTAARPLRPGETRQNGALATVGHLSTSLGAGLFVAGFSFGSVADGGGREEFGYGWPAFLTGSLLMLGGVPMLVAGAGITTPEERGRKRAKERGVSSAPLDLGPVTWSVGPGTALATWSWR